MSVTLIPMSKLVHPSAQPDGQRPPLSIASELSRATIAHRLERLNGSALSEAVELLIFEARPSDRPNDQNGYWTWKMTRCSTHEEVQRCLEAQSLLDAQPKPNHKIRIVSIPSQATVRPLKASAKVVQRIMEHYNVDIGFLDILESFGEPPKPSRAGWDSTFTKTKCIYRLQYPEQNHRSKQSPWSLRHTGVYHQHNEVRDSKVDHIFILLHTAVENPVDCALRSLVDRVSPTQFASRFGASVRDLHMFINETYLVNWGSYLHYLSERFSNENEEIATIDMYSAPTLSNGLAPAQQLRHLYDCALAAQPLCQANVSILHGLTNVLGDNSEKLRKRLDSCVEGFGALRDRVRNTNELLEYTVNFRNQAVATELNQTLLQLTRSAVDDSATVRIITIFSLIFLPGSFLATIFGTNFFVFDFDRGGLILGYNFWIFVAIWLPVTTFTLCIYFGIMWRRKCVIQAKTRSGAARIGVP